MTAPRDLSAVDRFAARLRAKLSSERCAQKAPWAGLSPSWLLGLLRDEVRELVAEVTAPTLEPERVADECVDVAAFAMMIADVVGGLGDGWQVAAEAHALQVGDGTAHGRIRRLELAEATRWEQRVKLLEARAEAAVAALRGTTESGAAERAAQSATPPSADVQAAAPGLLSAPELSAHGHGLAVGDE